MVSLASISFVCHRIQVFCDLFEQSEFFRFLVDFVGQNANIASMLKIRLQRVGRANDPSFRVVVTDSKKAAKKSGFVEILGSYNARKGKPIIREDRVKYWMSVGAKPSDTVHNLLINEKVISGTKINVLPKKSPIKKDEKKEATAV